MCRLDEACAPDQIATHKQLAERLSEQRAGQHDFLSKLPHQIKSRDSCLEGIAAETGEEVQTPVQGTDEAPSPFMQDHRDQTNVTDHVSEHACIALIASCRGRHAC